MRRNLESFEPLWPAEKLLIKEISSGLDAHIGRDVPSRNPSHERRVRASFLRYLVTGGCDSFRPPDRGIRIRGAFIESDGSNLHETPGINLESCALQFDLSLIRCRIPHLLLLRGCQARSFFFDESIFSNGISAERLNLSGSFCMRNADVSGILRINIANITGTIDFTGSRFRAAESLTDPLRFAIYGEGIEIKGSLLLRKTRVSGEINLNGAKIGGQLSFVDAILSPQGNGRPLSCECIEVRESILFHDCHVTGEIRLVAATIGGLLEFDGGTFYAQLYKDFFGSPAIFADGIKVERDLSFRDARVLGLISLNGARIGLKLDCELGQFSAFPYSHSQRGRSLSASDTEAASFSLKNLRVTGEFYVPNSRIGVLDIRNARFRNIQGISNTFYSFVGDGIKVDGSVYGQKVQARGEFRLLGAEIGRGLLLADGKFSDGQELSGIPTYCLSLDAVTVGGRVHLDNLLTNGIVTFRGARLESDLVCSNAKFVSGDKISGYYGIALVLDGAIVKGTFHLKGSTIKGILDLTATKLDLINDDINSWPPKGGLLLDRCIYTGFPRDLVDVNIRLDWLNLQYSDESSTSFFPQPYEQLAKVLREMGHSEGAKTVLIKLEFLQRAAELKRMRGPYQAIYYIFTKILQIVGFGYRPLGAVIPALLVILTGTFVISYANSHGAMIVETQKELSHNTDGLFPLVYSFETFVPIVKLGQAEKYRPDILSKIGYRTQLYLWVHSLLGWLIGGVAVAGILGLFRRN